MLKIYYNKDIYNKLNSTGYEFSFCCNILKKELFNQPRFLPVLLQGDNNIQYTSKEDADYHLMPYKWHKESLYNKIIIDEALAYNKKLIVSYIDDSQPNIDISNSIILKANIDLDKKKENEICIPIYPNTEYHKFDTIDNLKIGFCGQSDKPMLRKNVCEYLKNIYDTDIIYRDKFHWFYSERELNFMRIEYINNLKNNLFNLAIRGVGNFSYRLCEIMHFGRIPIIIRTNNCLPLEEHIDWSKSAIICDEKDIFNLNDKIDLFIKQNDLFFIQSYNRKIWEDWLSPLGF